MLTLQRLWFKPLRLLAFWRKKIHSEEGEKIEFVKIHCDCCVVRNVLHERGC